ncbi:MAG: RDD family protein [Lacibacter sp.]
MKIADKGTRLANFLIDGICFYILYVLIYFVAVNLYYYFNNDYLFIPGIFFYLLYFFYYFFFELFSKSTPGKMLTRTIVKNTDGTKPTLKSIFIRNILRLIPYDQLSFLFGFVGLHDDVSKTIVCYK